MTDLIVVPQTNQWSRLKALVLDSVSSPITKRVHNLGPDEFFAWLSVQEPRPGFTKATVSAWRVALEARGLGAASINVRTTAVRKLAVEAAGRSASASPRRSCGNYSGHTQPQPGFPASPRTIAAGGELEQIQLLLGHASVQ